MKRLICILASVLLLCSCSSRQAQTTDAEISVSILNRSLISQEEGTYSENRWTKWVNENSPVKVNWIPISRNHYSQALDIMFNANTAPDLIVSTSRDLMQSLADKNLIQPIDEYIDKYSTEYSEYSRENEHFRLYTTLNQKNYLFTSEAETTAKSAIWLRKDWLDALGLAVPENTEQLLEVARAFTYSDPDGNGIHDTIGIAFTSDIFKYIFMVDQEWYTDDADKIYISQLSERYLDMLLYKRQFFEEGLIDRNFILDTDSQKQMQTWLSGKAGILFSDWNADEFRSLLKDKPSVALTPIAPIATSYGKNGTQQNPPVGNYIAFNSDMKSPESGIKFLDWMISKGYQTLSHGIEGEHYINEYGFLIPIDVEKNNTELDYAAFDMPVLRKGTISPAQILKSAPKNSVIDQTIARLNSESLAISLENSMRQTVPVGISANVTKVNYFETEWELLIKNIETEFILSSLTGSPIDRDELRALLLNEYNRLGGESAQYLMQKWYDENKYSFYYALE